MGIGAKPTSIRADVVRKLDRGEPEPETLASGSAASPEALDASTRFLSDSHR